LPGEPGPKDGHLRARAVQVGFTDHMRFCKPLRAFEISACGD
jgi:hypothetical protein